MADNDESGTGIREAEKAGNRWGMRVIMPPVIGDANDYVQGGHDLLALLAPKLEGWLVAADDFLQETGPHSMAGKTVGTGSSPSDGARAERLRQNLFSFGLVFTDCLWTPDVERTQGKGRVSRLSGRRGTSRTEGTGGGVEAASRHFRAVHVAFQGWV